MRPQTNPLKEPVDRFLDDLTPVLQRIASEIGRRDLDKLPRDLVNEAFNLCCACIDSDGLHTDNEIWSLIETFAGRVDSSLARATPADVRRLGILAGRSSWFDEPSLLLDILLRNDKPNDTQHGARYYRRGLEVAFAMASLDTHTSTDELAAIERWRDRLLLQFDAMGVPRPGSTHRGTDADPGQPGNSGEAGGSKSTDGPDATLAKANAEGPVEAEIEELPPPRPLEELLAELDELIGLDSVKDEVKLVADLIRVQNLRRDRDMPVPKNSRHLVFTGNPGTGKTTVARLLAQIYRTLEVVERGHLVETDRSGLVVGYVGQTAPKVAEVMEQAEEGVLLIDEAYSLVRGGERDFGREAIDALVKLMEDRRDRVVVIAAGYPDEMEDFINSNPGLRSRFSKTIHFPDYETSELVAIYELLARKGGYLIGEGATEAITEYIESQNRGKGFGNGRLARNLFEDSVARHASRVVKIVEPTDDDLQTLVASDIPEPGEQ